MSSAALDEENTLNESVADGSITESFLTLLQFFQKSELSYNGWINLNSYLSFARSCFNDLKKIIKINQNKGGKNIQRLYSL